jgi:hypothetical protein
MTAHGAANSRNTEITLTEQEQQNSNQQTGTHHNFDMPAVGVSEDLVQGKYGMLAEESL